MLVEMANTVSNLATVGFALFGLLRCNAEKLPMRFALGYLGIALIGVGSAYFHGTLLFQAQLADELPMIYVASMPLWLLFDLDTKFDMKTRRTRILGYSVVAFDVLFTWS
ncbi:unnamed protein product [Mycena citricolor]|uniref:Alkaline phytoceramidase n=1 Tax=Mycena citricolor TaxID=2018698 RepID=A0AAD2GVC0_9AGAR|nr:unnamed protein product [Mycena citricolor]